VLTSNVATIALGICLAGTAWRISRWFLSDIGSESDGLSTGQRLAATGRALPGALIHPGIWKNTRIFLWEIVLQGHLLQRLFQQILLQPQFLLQALQEQLLQLQ